jgi:sodium-coupled neutral amino acid transporter 11
MFTTLPLEVFVCREVRNSSCCEEMRLADRHGLCVRCVQVIENLLDRPFSYKRHAIVTTCLVISAMLVSMTTCDLGIGESRQQYVTQVSLTQTDWPIVLELTGGLSATALAFLVSSVDYDVSEDLRLIVSFVSPWNGHQFPAACYYRLLSEPWYGRRKLCAAACTCFGLVVMFLSLILALQKLYTGDSHASKVCT